MDLEETNKQLKNIYEGIEEYCKYCDLCCYTYGWIMPCESNKYSEIDNLVTINDKVVCFDSFEENKSGDKVLEKIPRCKFYGDKNCQINSVKPFDCLLYPVKVLYLQRERRYAVVLSLDCPYIESLNHNCQKYLIEKILSFFSSMSPKIKLEYFKLVKEWEHITKQKRFEYLEILSYSEEEVDKLNTD